MSQENYEIVRNIKRKPMVVLFTVIGGCCMLQFFVVGIINVIRGYSIGSYWPTGILLAGIFIFILLLAKYRKKPAIASSYSYVISFVIIYFCLIGFSQGKYRQKATKCYIDGQYQQALEACEKEVGPWYHLLKYNSHERVAMDIMAKAYCQLEDFDRAGDIYKLMTARYSGEFYGGRAEANLEDLEKGLEIIAYYPDNLASMPKTDYMRDKKRNVDAEYFELVALCNVVGAYKSYLHCDSKAREVYTEFLEKDVSDERNTLAIEDSIMKGRESRVGGEL